MKTPTESPSTSTSPSGEPTLLGPYGEGYCPHCRFIEPLGPDGLIEEHYRGWHNAPSGSARQHCPGSRTVPGAVPGPEVEGFTTEPKPLYCPKCRTEAPTGAHTQGGYYLRHVDPVTVRTCSWSWADVPKG